MVPESALPWLIRSHIAAGRVVLPQSSPNIAVVPIVVGAQNRPDGLSCLLSMVVRHLGEEVVCDMRVGDVVVQVVQNKAIVAVDGGERTTQPVPLRILVVGEFGVGVLQAVEGSQGGCCTSAITALGVCDTAAERRGCRLSGRHHTAAKFDMRHCKAGLPICWMA